MNPEPSIAGSLKLRDRVLDLSFPAVMGVLNVTPDSFSDGGRFFKTGRALTHIREMKEEGAVIIDVGGESTRPGADTVSTKEELARVIPVIEKAVQNHPDLIFSIDTTKYEVAHEALETGIHIVNDVSGLQKDPRLAELCAEYGAGLVIMHSPGDPKTMQQNPTYTNVVQEVGTFLKEQTALARQYGVEQIIIDPGIGFGKTIEHNLQLLANLDTLQSTGRPVMIGASRKSMIGALTHHKDPAKRLAGTLAVHYDAMMRGARIIRVHDVAETVDTIRIFKAIREHRDERV